MSVHKEIIFTRQVTERIVFDVTAERERIAYCAEDEY